MNITLGSLFDGSGGFPLAGCLCDIEPVWASEIEPYPIAVTRSQFPEMLHLGDISKINGAKIQPVNVISFGSPCQGLSLAGLRKGLEDQRSGLFMEAIRIIKEMRCATNGKYPRFAVWENVPGAFSSNKGEDFRIVLEEIIKINEPTATVPAPAKGKWPYADTYMGDGWSLAYRTFDAQYWGVPQRRRRIYLVADFAGRCAARVLFEREGLRGYFTQSPTSWQGASSDAEGSPGTDDRGKQKTIELKETISLSPVASTLCAGAGVPKHEQDFVGRLCIVKEPLAFHLLQDPTSGAVSPCMGQGNSKNGQASIGVCEAVNVIKKVGFDGYNSTLTGEKSATLGVNCGVSTGRNGVIEREYNSDFVEEPTIYTRGYGGTVTLNGITPTLEARAGTGGNNQPIVAYKTKEEKNEPGCVIAIDKESYSSGEGWNRKPGITVGGPCATLQAQGIPHAVCYCAPTLFENHLQDARYNGPLKVSPTLQARLGTGGNNQPIVVEGDHVYCIQGNCIDRSDTAGCNGKGWREGASFTLNTIDRPAVSYLASGKDKFGTLQANAGTKQCLGNQEAQSGDYHIIEEHPKLYRESSFAGYTGGTCGTLKASGGALGGGSESLVVEYKPRYIVRRLTPVECARLQGFADSWGVPDYKESLTEEEYAFWLEVKHTYEAINGRTPKEYTREQILKWYNRLHTNGAEYKMWGNGVALPPTLYVMQGIHDVMNDERT